jgi:hypothetical protein
LLKVYTVGIGFFVFIYRLVLLCHFTGKELLSFVDIIMRADLVFLVVYIGVIVIRKERVIAKTGLLTH